MAQVDAVNDTAGNVEIDEVDALLVTQITNTTAGAVLLETGGYTEVLALGGGISTGDASQILVEVTNDSTLQVNDGVTSQGGNIGLYADDDVLFSNDGDVASNNGNIIVIADADGDMNGTGGALTMSPTTTINAGTGTIEMRGDELVTLGQVSTNNATANAVSITSTSNMIIGENTLFDIVANQVGAVTTLTAATGIGTAGDALDTEIYQLDAHVVDAGIINISEDDAIILNDVDTYNGNITIAGAVNQNGVMQVVDVEAGADVIVGNGDVTLTTGNASDMQVNRVAAYMDTVNLNAAGDMDELTPDAVADIVGGTLNLVSGGHIGTTAQPIEIDASDVLNATSGGAVGDDIVLVDTLEDLPVGAVFSGLGDTYLTADDSEAGGDNASILDETETTDAFANIVGDTVTLTAISGIGDGRMADNADLDLAVNSLIATVTGPGNINVDEVDTITVENAFTTDGDIYIRAGLDPVIGAGVGTVYVGVIDADQVGDNTVTVLAADSIYDDLNGLFDGEVDIFSGGDTNLSVVNGFIGGLPDLLEVTVGGNLNLEAQNASPRGPFWAALRGTAGGEVSSEFVQYVGDGDTPPGMIYWNGDVIGGQEDQMFDYSRSERVKRALVNFTEDQPIVDQPAVFMMPNYFFTTIFEYEQYWNIPVIEFLNPGVFFIQGLPTGPVEINVQELLDDASAVNW
jgi:hypothetical protein